MACCGKRVLQNHVARYDSQSTALPWWGWSSDGPTKMTTNWLTWPSTRRGQTIERPQATRVAFSAVVLISPLLKTDQNSSFKVRRQMLTLCRIEPQTPKRWEALYYLILGRFTALFWIILVKTALAHSVTIPSSRCPFESFKDLHFRLLRETSNVHVLGVSLTICVFEDLGQFHHAGCRSRVHRYNCSGTCRTVPSPAYSQLIVLVVTPNASQCGGTVEPIKIQTAFVDLWKEWINCYKDGDVQASATFISRILVQVYCMMFTAHFHSWTHYIFPKAISQPDDLWLHIVANVNQ